LLVHPLGVTFTSDEFIKLYPLHAMEAHGGRGGIAPTHT
jgi:hypothetical protein